MGIGLPVMAQATLCPHRVACGVGYVGLRRLADMITALEVVVRSQYDKSEWPNCGAADKQ